MKERTWETRQGAREVYTQGREVIYHHSLGVTDLPLVGFSWVRPCAETEINNRSTQYKWSREWFQVLLKRRQQKKLIYL